ncbi:MAG: hypothetical protein IT432_00205 [Phycisphaerales bacterium]|nr:hypothetical protein [Phycisphaerales bacterium]
MAFIEWIKSLFSARPSSVDDSARHVFAMAAASQLSSAALAMGCKLELPREPRYDFIETVVDFADLIVDRVDPSAALFTSQPIVEAALPRFICGFISCDIADRFLGLGKFEMATSLLAFRYAIRFKTLNGDQQPAFTAALLKTGVASYELMATPAYADCPAKNFAIGVYHYILKQHPLYITYISEQLSATHLWFKSRLSEKAYRQALAARVQNAHGPNSLNYRQ